LIQYCQDFLTINSIVTIGKDNVENQVGGL